MSEIKIIASQNWVNEKISTVNTEMNLVNTRLDNIEDAVWQIPDYVVTEAMSVLDNVISAQGNRTFVLGAIADMHYGSSDYIDGVIHATQGLKHISDRIKLDAIAVLGDYTDEHQMDTETAVTDLEEMNALLDPLRHNVNLRLKGNHDHRPAAAAQTYRYIMAYSDDVVWGSRIGGYFYRDFEEYKLRVICLNTTEIARDNLAVSTTQYNFFIDSLNLSSKEDASKWGILLLSHHPLDFTVSSGNYRFVPIINAYKNGTSWTDGTVSCDYTNKNAATIIANIHGHLHNLLTDKLYIGVPGSSAQIDVYRLCTPASRVDYVNHYSAPWIEDTWYNKTQNTAEDTSFCIYCIDLDTYTLKAYCYGAGYDREISYGVAPIVNLIDTIGYQDNMRVNSSGSYASATGYTSSGRITVSPGDVIRTRGVNFDAAEQQYCNIHFWANDGANSYIVTNSSNNLPYNDDNFTITIDADNNLTIIINNSYPIEITLTGYGVGADLIVLRNQTFDDESTDEPDDGGTTPSDPTNLIDTVGYTDGKRYSASSHGLKDATGYTCTGEISLSVGDVIETSGVNFDSTEHNYCNIAVINDSTDWTLVTNDGSGATNNYFEYSVDNSNNLTLTVKSLPANERIRLTGYGSGANLVVTRNQ